MKYKKSQGLPINTIIIATIGLLVLVVIVLIFTGQVSLFSKSTECTARGGKCLSEIGSQCPDDHMQIFTKDCKLVKNGVTQEETPGQCCIPLE